MTTSIATTENMTVVSDKVDNVVLIPLAQLVSDDNVNNRTAGATGSYKLETFQEQLLLDGKVNDALTVEKMTRTDGTVYYLILRGNRRFRASLLIHGNQNLTPAQKAPFVALPCIVKEGLTEAERTNIIFDQGTVSDLTREETVLAVWRMAAQLKSPEEIATRLFMQLGKMGDAKKLNQIPTDANERREYLKTWFRGTLEQWILYGAAMGPYIREQFLLTVRRMDGNIPEKYEGWELNCTRPRIGKLYKAKTFDQSGEGTGWTVQDGGQTFNELVQKFKDEDKGIAPKAEGDKRMKDAVIRQRADQFKSDELRSAFQATLGNEAAALMIPSIDDKLSRAGMVRDTVAKLYSRVAEPAVRRLLDVLILSDCPAGETESALAPFLAPAPAEQGASPAPAEQGASPAPAEQGEEQGASPAPAPAPGGKKKKSAAS